MWIMDSEDETLEKDEVQALVAEVLSGGPLLTEEQIDLIEEENE